MFSCNSRFQFSVTFCRDPFWIKSRIKVPSYNSHFSKLQLKSFTRFEEFSWWFTVTILVELKYYFFLEAGKFFFHSMYPKNSISFADRFYSLLRCNEICTRENNENTEKRILRKIREQLWKQTKRKQWKASLSSNRGRREKIVWRYVSMNDFPHLLLLAAPISPFLFFSSFSLLKH